MFRKQIVLVFLLLALWLLLTAGDTDSLIVGLCFIGLAVFVSSWLAKKTKQLANQPQLRLVRLPKFIVFFVVQSVIGGVNTALLACRLKMKLSPEFIHYRITVLQPGRSVALFVTTVSLLPGSVSVLRESDGLLIHVLSVNENTIKEVYNCEMAVAELYGLEPLKTNVSSAFNQE